MVCQFYEETQLEKVDITQPAIILCRRDVHTVWEEFCLVHFGKTYQMAYNPYGKPQCEGLHFNFSHSADYGVIAYHPIKEIGVDMECFRPLLNVNAIMDKYFHTSEKEAYEQSSDPVRTFFQIWTFKEAIGKKLGYGLRAECQEIETHESEEVQFFWYNDEYVICVNYE